MALMIFDEVGSECFKNKGMSILSDAIQGAKVGSHHHFDNPMTLPLRTEHSCRARFCLLQV